MENKKNPDLTGDILSDAEKMDNHYDAKKELLYSKGYHLASKYVLCDPEISITAKAIYCYLRSLCRDDFSHRVFPSIERQLLDLEMSRKTYYKARAELVNAGIIKIVANKNSGNFDNNTYEFPLQPQKYMVDRTDTPFAKWLPFIRSRGVLATFGFAPFFLMSYKGLDYKAKVFCVYISAHAKNHLEDPYAELSPQMIMFHLGITESTCRKYLAQLKDHGFIFVERLREAGKLRSISRYGIIETGPYGEGVGKKETDIVAFAPKASEPTGKNDTTVDAPTGKNDTTVDAPTGKNYTTVDAPTGKNYTTVDAPTGKNYTTVDAPTGKNYTTVNAPTGKNDTTVKPTAVKDTTISTCLINTSVNQIFFDRYRNIIISNLVDVNMEVWIRYKKDTTFRGAADLLADAIATLVTSQNETFKIKNREYSISSIAGRALKADSNTFLQVIDRCLNKSDDIHNLKAYLLTSLLNELGFTGEDDEGEEDAI